MQIKYLLTKLNLKLKLLLGTMFKLIKKNTSSGLSWQEADGQKTDLKDLNEILHISHKIQNSD